MLIPGAPTLYRGCDRVLRRLRIGLAGNNSPRRRAVITDPRRSPPVISMASATWRSAATLFEALLGAFVGLPGGAADLAFGD